jgi:hypothetical protein
MAQSELRKKVIALIESGENLSVSEIAARIGKPRGTVSCIMSRLKLRSNSRMVQDKVDRGIVR